MDRDPVSNLHFRNRLAEGGNLSPIASSMYDRIFRSYRAMHEKTVEVWLWCRPGTAAERVKLRGRESEKALTVEDLEAHQIEACMRILSVYASRPASKAERRIGNRFSQFEAFPSADASGLVEYARSRPIAVVNWDRAEAGSSAPGFGCIDSLLDSYRRLCQGAFPEPVVRTFLADPPVAETDAFPTVRILSEAEPDMAITTVWAGSVGAALRDYNCRELLFRSIARASEMNMALEISFFVNEQ